MSYSRRAYWAEKSITTLSILLLFPSGEGRGGKGSSLLLLPHPILSFQGPYFTPSPLLPFLLLLLLLLPLSLTRTPFQSSPSFVRVVGLCWGAPTLFFVDELFLGRRYVVLPLECYHCTTIVVGKSISFTVRRAAQKRKQTLPLYVLVLSNRQEILLIWLSKGAWECRENWLVDYVHG